MAMRSVVLVLALIAVPRAARAQCPDGSPPPCGARRPPTTPAASPARASVPNAALRAKRLLLLPFRNLTRAPAQDWLVQGAPVMLGSALGQLNDLQVVPEERLTAALRRASLPLDGAPDATQLRRLAEETGGWTGEIGRAHV